MQESSHKKYVLVKSFDFTNPEQRSEFFNSIISFPEKIISIPVMLQLHKSARNIYKINVSELNKKIKLVEKITYLNIYDKSKPTERIMAISVKAITRITILREESDGKNICKKNIYY